MPIMNETAEQRSMAKWGEAGRAFQLLPDILLKKQVELGLTATDMLVLLNVTLHWWYADKKPFPRTSTIAARMGIEPRTVQRTLRKLSDLGLMKRVPETAEDGTQRTVCDLSGLVERLGKYAEADPDYIVRARRQAERMVA